MKRIGKKAFLIGFIGCLIFSTPTLANVIQQEKDTSKSKVVTYADPRGQYISFSTASITNDGAGVIGISAVTTAHESVDKIRIHLYLDRLNENEKWIQVDDFDFTFLPKDMPNGELGEATVSFKVKGQPAGYYYRVRGTHGVWKNGVSESQSTRTNGVLITNP